MIKTSVVIPVYNEEKDIGECIESLLKQSCKNFEIIIVDDGSTDKTRTIVGGFKRVKLVEGKHKGPGFSRNLGASAAKGEFLVFVDADMTFDKDYLKNLVAPIEGDKTRALIGTTHDYETVKNTSNIWSRCWGRVRVDGRRLGGKLAPFGSPFRAILKKKFFELGGFDPKYGYADDQSFWIKYRLNPVYAPNTTCYHRNPETLKSVYKQSRWIGASFDSFFTRATFFKNLSPIVLVLVFPVAIPILSLKRCFKIENFTILPQMLVFMTARYFGTIAGLFRKAYEKNNTR